MLIVLSLRNADLNFKVSELTAALKDMRHLGRTKIWEGPFQTERMTRTKHRVRNRAC